MNAIEKLEDSKSSINKAISAYFQESYNVNVGIGLNVADAIYQDSRIIIRNLAKEHKMEIPVFIKESRTINEALNHITNNIDQYDNEYTLTQYVNSCFNGFIDLLEDEQIDVQIIHVPSEIPEHLTFAHIKEDLAKCEKRFNEEDYSGAITSARSLVEGVCNEILVNLTGTQLEEQPDLPALFKQVRKNLNLDTKNPKLEQPLKQVLNGLVNIVNGLAQIRNENGDAHHRRYEVNKHHALVVINSAKTVVTFLFNTYEYQLEKGTLVKA
jgi:hypothetical protein